MIFKMVGNGYAKVSTEIVLKQLQLKEISVLVLKV